MLATTMSVLADLSLGLLALRIARQVAAVQATQGELLKELTTRVISLEQREPRHNHRPHLGFRDS